MRVSTPHNEPRSNEHLSSHLLGELGLNLGDLEPYQLDEESLQLDEPFCDAEIHGPREAWEGVE